MNARTSAPERTPVVQVEVCGAHLGAAEISCSAGPRHFRYVADAALKPGQSFSFGAYFSKAVLSDDVFRYPRSQRVAVLAESPIDRCYAEVDEVVRRFPIVFTHQRHLLQRGAPFLPLTFGTNWIGVVDEAASRAIADEHPRKDRLVSFIGSLEHPDTGAYRLRREIAQFALGRGDVDCFGRGIRPIEGKREAIAPYRFSIAMENAAADDYFSEKLVDCLLLETVPIYYGWPSAGSSLDERGLLRFEDAQQLAAVLDSLSPALYERLLPFAMANKARVIVERWHNHQGMLARMSAQLPPGLLAAAPIPFRAPGRFSTTWRRLRQRLSAALRPPSNHGTESA